MATIENYVKPRRLFRYRSIKDNLHREIDAIEHGYLHCASYKDLNDPMEGTFSSSSTLRSNDRYRSIKEAILDEKSHTGMCSFSEVHNHELMWTHYADRFAGICISYSLSMLLRHLPNEVCFSRMYYNEKVPVLRHAHLPPSQQARMILSYKNYKWLYEREWRMFGSIGPVYYHKMNCVTHVYLGSKISPPQRALITEEMRRVRIKVSDLNVGKYSLTFV